MEKTLKKTDKIEVTVEGPCTDIKVVDDTQITAKIPGPDFFVGISDLAIFQRKQLVVVKDGRGYTSTTIFTIKVEFDGTYISNLFAWMGRNPMWTLIIFAAILLPIALILYCCCKGFKKPKKPKKKDHTENPTDRYYDDHYGVDDYYDDYDRPERRGRGRGRGRDDDDDYRDYYDYKK